MVWVRSSRFALGVRTGFERSPAAGSVMDRGLPQGVELNSHVTRRS